MDDFDRIHIEDLHLRGIIGLNDWEREKPQDIVINVTLYTDVRDAGRTDDAAYIVNYRTVTKDIVRYVEESSHYLVESLATAIARICVVDHGVRKARVRVDKPGALRFARTVAVEIVREASDFGA